MRGGKVERIAGGDVGVDGDFEFSIVAPEGCWPGAANDRGHIFETHLPQLGRGHHHLCKDVRIVALTFEELHDDRILFGTFLKASDLVFAGIKKTDGVADIAHAHTYIRGALTIQLDL